jgi:hypothetical protein
MGCWSCGDGNVNPGEQCDGANLGGNSCQSLNYQSGNLTCTGNCTYNTNGCIPYPVCGNGVREGMEACDGADLGGQTCQGLGYGPGGSLSCGQACNFNTNNCVPLAACGNGVVDMGEQCDGMNLNGQSCASQGYPGGNLGCDGACHYNYAGCWQCGNNIVDPNEDCDGGLGMSCGPGCIGGIYCENCVWIDTGCDCTCMDFAVPIPPICDQLGPVLWE